MSPVAVTGLGVVTAFGVGAPALRQALLEGRGGLAPIRHFDTARYPSHLAGTVPGFDTGPSRKDAGFEFALLAGTEALAQARPQGRIALVFGTSIAVIEGRLHGLASRLAGALGLTGPVIAITTACCSSNNALGLGAEMLEAGDVDAVLAGGTDQITEEMFAGFSILGALSTGACAPFSFPTGTTLGEGAGFVVLLQPHSVPRLDLSQLDLPSRLVTCAVAEALGALGPIVKGELREGLGLFVGATEPSLEARTRLDQSIKQGGLTQLSAEAFTRMVTSAIGGACTRLLGLRGPFTTLTSGAGSGLVALACAARYLEQHDDVRGIVVAGVDEADEPGGEGRASAVLLVREGALPVTGPSLQVAFAGPQQVADALMRLGGAPGDVREDASVSGSLERLGEVLEDLRARGGSRVVGQALGTSTCAVRLTSSPEQP